MTFFMWIYLDTLPPPANAISGIPGQRFCLFRMLSVAGNGLEVFISEKGRLMVACAQAGSFMYAPVSPECLFS